MVIIGRQARQAAIPGDLAWWQTIHRRRLKPHDTATLD